MSSPARRGADDRLATTPAVELIINLTRGIFLSLDAAVVVREVIADDGLIPPILP